MMEEKEGGKGEGEGEERGVRKREPHSSGGVKMGTRLLDILGAQFHHASDQSGLGGHHIHPAIDHHLLNSQAPIVIPLIAGFSTSLTAYPYGASSSRFPSSQPPLTPLHILCHSLL